MSPTRKAYAYITRTATPARDVLVFRHRDYPEAGIQIPKGSVDAGEAPGDAVLREVGEEAGLVDVTLISALAVDEETQPDGARHERHFFHLVSNGARGAWDHVVTGDGEDHGMVFCYFWLDHARVGELWPGFGDYLHLILSTAE